MVFLEYDYLNQNQNRSEGSTASADNNNDKEIKTHFAKIGGKYLFNRAWGTQVEIPYWHRSLTNLNDDGNLSTSSHGAVGDIRINGIYTGASEDMSTGLTFGLKLPTGDSTFSSFDPDTQIGSGSTDILLGAYHLFKITASGDWSGFTQINLDQPLISKPNYSPGNEINAAVGAYYGGWHLSPDFRLAPIFETLFSVRGVDTGSSAGDSGYRRVLIAPGVEADLGSFRLFSDVEIPIAQYFNGNQLAAPIAYKVALMFMF